MVKRVYSWIFVVLLILVGFSSITSACIVLNETSTNYIASNTTICTGVYYINNSDSTSYAVYLNGSYIWVDFNYSTIIGNGSGGAIENMIVDPGNYDVTIRNLYLENYSDGIVYRNTDKVIIQNVSIKYVDKGIYFKKEGSETNDANFRNVSIAFANNVGILQVRSDGNGNFVFNDVRIINSTQGANFQNSNILNIYNSYFVDNEQAIYLFNSSTVNVYDSFFNSTNFDFLMAHSTDVKVYNSVFENYKIDFTNAGNFTSYYDFIGGVKDVEDNSTIVGASFKMYDSSLNKVIDTVTNGAGLTSNYLLKSYSLVQHNFVPTNYTEYNYNNYTINITYAGYENYSSEFKLNDNGTFIFYINVENACVATGNPWIINSQNIVCTDKVFANDLSVVVDNSSTISFVNSSIFQNLTVYDNSSIFVNDSNINRVIFRNNSLGFIYGAIFNYMDLFENSRLYGSYLNLSFLNIFNSSAVNLTNSFIFNETIVMSDVRNNMTGGGFNLFYMNNSNMSFTDVTAYDSIFSYGLSESEFFNVDFSSGIDYYFLDSSNVYIFGNTFFGRCILTDNVNVVFNQTIFSFNSEIHVNESVIVNSYDSLFGNLYVDLINGSFNVTNYNNLNDASIFGSNFSLDFVSTTILNMSRYVFEMASVDVHNSTIDYATFNNSIASFSDLSVISYSEFYGNTSLLGNVSLAKVVYFDPNATVYRDYFIFLNDTGGANLTIDIINNGTTVVSFNGSTGYNYFNLTFNLTNYNSDFGIYVKNNFQFNFSLNGSSVIYVVSDIISPNVTVIYPVYNFTSTSQSLFNLTVDELVDCNYTINGGPVSLFNFDNGTSFMANLSLIYGQNNISYECADSYGNDYNSTYELIFDNVLPNVSSLIFNNLYLGDDVNFSFNVTDDYSFFNCSAQLYNGSFISGVANNTIVDIFNVSFVNLNDDTYSLNISCVDYAYNIGSRIFNFSVDDSLPVISHVYLSDYIVQNNTQVSLFVNATSYSGISNITASYGAVYDFNLTSGEPYVIFVNLTDELSFISVNVTDIYGRSANSSVYFLIDDVLPAISVVEIEFNYLSNSQNISYVVNITDEDNTTIDFVTAEGNYLYWNGSVWTGFGSIDNDGQIDVFVYDFANNSDFDNSTTYYIDSGVPNVTLRIPFYDYDSGYDDDGQLFWNVSIVDDTNLTEAYYYLDGVKVIVNESIGKGSVSFVGIINFGPGRHIFSFHAKDFAGNIGFDELVFYSNSTLNYTNWVNGLLANNSLISNVSMYYENGTEVFGNVSNIIQKFNLIFNTQNETYWVYDFNGLNASWYDYFYVNDSSTFSSTVSTLHSTDVSYFSNVNMNLFLRPTDYDAQAIINFTGFDSLWFFNSTDDVTQYTLVDLCNGTDELCYDVVSNRTIISMSYLSLLTFQNDTVGPDIIFNKPIDGGVEAGMVSLNISTLENATCMFNFGNGWYNFTNYGFNFFEDLMNDSYHPSSKNKFSDGTKLLNISCTDIYSNVNYEAINFIVNDTTPPVFTVTYSVSGDDVTFIVDSNELCYCRYSESNLEYISMVGDYGLNKHFSFTLSDLPDGTHSRYIACADEKANYNISLNKAISFSILSGGSGSSSGGSSSGSSSGSYSGTYLSAPVTVNSYKETQRWMSLAKNQWHTMNLINDLFSFEIIDFRLNTNVESFTMDVILLSETHESVPLIDTDIYEYLEVNYPGYNSSVFMDGKITFKVAKSWLADNEISKYDVVLFRYQGSWTEYSARILGDDVEYVVYEADVPGFSYFAVGLSKIKNDVKITGNVVDNDVTVDGRSDGVINSVNSTVDGDDTITDDLWSFGKWISVMLILILIVGAGGALGSVYLNQNSAIFLKPIELSNGFVIKDINQIPEALKMMNPGSFMFHVNKFKNDFYDFILPFDKELAGQIMNVLDFSKFYSIIMNAKFKTNSELSYLIKLREYIDIEREKGFTDAQIKEKLQESKWPDELIKKAF